MNRAFDLAFDAIFGRDACAPLDTRESLELPSPAPRVRCRNCGVIACECGEVCDDPECEDCAHQVRDGESIDDFFARIEGVE